MNNLFTLFMVLGAAWAVQLFFAWRQALKFQKQLGSLRKESGSNGAVAVGVGGRRYRGGRAFVALSTDASGIIKSGLLLTGFTVLAKGKPFTDYTGFHIDDIISGDRVAANRKPKVIAAAKMAAEHIKAYLDRKSDPKSESKAVE